MCHIKKQSLLFQSCLPDESFLIKIEKEWQDHCNQSVSSHFKIFTG